ncbi:MAG: hypothetical protein C5S49_00305 [Candidatus Methanogaster sp.]|nr:MAG: hypothetical protein C5S49_00305 [ANME-2 cluster archaeon]
MLPFKFSRIGRWWHKDDEIDIVALNEGTKEILFIECKWKHLDHRSVSRVIGSLKEKAKHFRWNNEKRKEYFGIMAKKIEDKEKFRKIGYLVFDLDDL